MIFELVEKIWRSWRKIFGLSISDIFCDFAEGTASEYELVPEMSFSVGSSLFSLLLK